MTDEFKRDRLCQCKTCLLTYEVVDFVELLADENKCKELDDEAKIPQEDRDKVKLIAAILVGAAAEYGFRHGAPPEQMFQWLIYFWNKKASYAIDNVVSGNPKGTPEDRAREKLEGYES